MFRLMRALMLILIAFVAGVFFEQASHRDMCVDRGGEVSDGICLGAEE